jgi:hypothetical protein
MKNQQGNSINKPCYPHEPICGLGTLAKALGIHEQVLMRVASRANQLYRLAAEETKPDGTKRQTFDANPVLKEIQTRIKLRILQRVSYPSYLTGSLKGCSPRTNASVHVGAKIAFAEDIANFFPSVSAELVKRMWSGLFRFSDDVGDILTRLTVKDNGIPQGAVTSSYLANLVFWNYEPKLVRSFEMKGLKYTRFVDDINVSSKRRLSTEEQAQIVSAVYGMLRKHGLQPKRKKHEVYAAGRRMIATKLMNNKRVALPPDLRQNIRTAVFQLEARVALGKLDGDLSKEIARVTSKVGRLGSFHPSEAKKLKVRMKLIRDKVASEVKYISYPRSPNPNQESLGSESPPWE